MQELMIILVYDIFTYVHHVQVLHSSGIVGDTVKAGGFAGASWSS
jgi:hypothetical protein